MNTQGWTKNFCYPQSLLDMIIFSNEKRVNGSSYLYHSYDQSKLLKFYGVVSCRIFN